VDVEDKDFLSKIELNFGPTARPLLKKILGEAATIDAVPVVRCKYCKHNNPSRAIGDSNMWCDYWGVDPDPDDFCSRGERKSE
jgi:hypothetical protein